MRALQFETGDAPADEYCKSHAVGDVALGSVS